MVNKLVPMVLFFLESGPKPKHKVTAKIKNYPKLMREDAIKFLMNEKLVLVSEGRNKPPIGRIPTFISLTEKGVEYAKSISREPRHNSVW